MNFTDLYITWLAWEFNFKEHDSKELAAKDILNKSDIVTDSPSISVCNLLHNSSKSVLSFEWPPRSLRPKIEWGVS